MIRKSGRRGFDLFSLVLTLLAIGMTLTLIYQVGVYHGGDSLPMAKQAPPSTIGG
jgi:hypothetical protein